MWPELEVIIHLTTGLDRGWEAFKEILTIYPYKVANILQNSFFQNFDYLKRVGSQETIPGK